MSNVQPFRRREAQPYGPGNRESVKHGAFSARVIDEKSREVHAELMAACVWVDEPDVVAVDTWCKAKARYDLLNDWVMSIALGERDVVTKRGILSGVDAVPAYLWGEVSKAESNLMKATESLGLDPTGRARLMKDLGMAKHFAADGVRELVSRGRELRRGSV